tara:strand:- start:25266 stop:26039 length:774 start_codon:yes stop_codon:yes gene_type:complete
MKKIFECLIELKKLGVTAVKQSTEDEGSSFKDILVMRRITKKIGIKLNVKIGGCEAKNDIFYCKRIKADAIVAPMVESDYALKKFIQCAGVNKKCSLYLNLETRLAIKNLNKIVSSNSFSKINGVVIGRSDLAGSMNKSKDYVNSKKIFKIAEKTYRYIQKKKNKKTIFKMGGSITELSKNFIEDLYNKGLLNYIETRNIEIKLSRKTLNNLDNIISRGFHFEKEWLKKRAQFIKKVDPFLAKDYQKRIFAIIRREN